MKFVLIFGPQAVGKMTVGHEIEKITDLKLFHNHMTIDSNENEIKKENYIRINNTNMSAEEVANLIKERFGL